MLKVLSASILALFVSGCMGGFYDDSGARCGGQPIKNVTVRYGDSELRVTPQVVKVKRQGGIRFRLSPQSHPTDQYDYEEMTATISGKTGTDSWIAAQGTDAANDNLLVCVPAMQAVATYNYKVEVENVGLLDPRAEVEY